MTNSQRTHSIKSQAEPQIWIWINTQAAITKSIDNSPSCWRSLRLRLVRGFLDHWESYDFTLTKIHCDVSHRCIARKFLFLLGAKTFSGKYAHCEPGSSSIERDSGCVADSSIVSESKAVLKDGACIPFLWSSTPAIVWSADRPQERGIHVHVNDGAKRIVDEALLNQAMNEPGTGTS